MGRRSWPRKRRVTVVVGSVMSLKVEVWSDVVCPWCYVGKRRFEAALARFAHHGEVELVWRSFELDVSAPPSGAEQGTYAQRLAIKYRCSVVEAQVMIDNMTATAAAEGLDFRFDLARPGNTFDAHRLLHLAPWSTASRTSSRSASTARRSPRDPQSPIIPRCEPFPRRWGCPKPKWTPC